MVFLFSAAVENDANKAIRLPRSMKGTETIADRSDHFGRWIGIEKKEVIGSRRGT
jgi:hypothetical protein